MGERGREIVLHYHPLSVLLYINVNILPVLFSCLNLAEMRLNSLVQTTAASNFTARPEAYGRAN